MSGPSLKTLKIRVDQLVIGAVAVVVLVGGIVAWSVTRTDPEQDKLEAGRERLRKRTGDGVGTMSQAGPRFVRGYHSASSSGSSDAEIGEGVAVLEPPPQRDPGDLSAEAAVTSFEQVIGELETALEDGRRLSAREEAELYNRATGSFTALSAWVDPSDPGERALMNDAHARMLALMRELDIERPAHDPNFNPLRR